MTQKITSLMALGFFLAGCVRPTADDATIHSQRTHSSNRVHNKNDCPQHTHEIDNAAMGIHLKETKPATSWESFIPIFPSKPNKKDIPNKK